MHQSKYEYLLMLGDNSIILGHRLSELCGHGPSLETDIALTNISLDLFGQVRSYFQHAAELKDEDATEDSIAFLRMDREYRNSILVEQPNTDFAHVIVRQFLFDSFHLPLLEQLIHSKDETIAAIAAKSIKESKYHLRFSSEWVKRLGDGTEESHKRAQAALDHLYPYLHELFEESPIEKEMKESGVGADLSKVEEKSRSRIHEVMLEANLAIPEIADRMVRGKQGIHSEHMGFILSDVQYMQRAYPNMQW
ncbi:1,2-phenylacetyl-CoA epoxidase subunit PaaC [Marinoscillum sp.]|uniref:1,2-phenylacetyl-CoA epoxidase subunit PaaC n=1 Tax=Marinoscillum sp. TaxID=2024838 RepID=UPI003BAB263D